MAEKKLFSIVTPVFNGEKYLEQTIQSIMVQSYQNFEHIIVDGGSTDHTLEIIKRYEGKYPMRYISEPDRGMYDAINKGFSMAKGDIYCWLNADDIYFPHALDTVARVMEEKEINWCTGSPMTMTRDGHFFAVPKVNPVYFSRYLKKGYMDGRINSVVQQESTFFRKELWLRGGGIDASLKYAGDYFLWITFAKYDKLYTLDAPLAAFRMYQGQKSSSIEQYYGEMKRFGLWKRFLAKTKLVKIMTYLRSMGRTEQFIYVHPFLTEKE